MNLYEILGAPSYEDPLERHASARLDDTCDWILRKACYQDWSSEIKDKTAKFLWLYGLPGTGKTIICATIIKQLQKSSPLVLHYFSSAHNHSDTTLDVIIRHWLLKIARYHQNGFLLIIGALQHVYRGEVLSVPDTWTVFEYVVPRLKSCTFVLDGFDEFTISSRAGFLIKLKQHVRDMSTKVLIVSRDESDIRSELASNSSTTLGISFSSYQIEKEDTRTDIELVSNKIVQNKLTGQDESLLNRLASTLVERCDGMFLWVELAAKRLNNGESAASLNRIVNRAPAGLDDLYKRKWQDVLQEPEVEDRLRALRILTWCTYALNPLTVSQLSEAIIVRPDDTARDFDEDELTRPISNEFITYCIMRLCGPFLEIRSTATDEPLADRTVHLVHASAKEFLSPVLPHFSLSDGSKETRSLESAPHLFVSKVCLRYLCYKNIGRAAIPSDKFKWTFHQYANDHWHKHQKLSHIYDQEYHGLATKFFNVDNTNFTSWSATFEHSSEEVEEESGFVFRSASPLYYATLLNMAPIMENIFKSDMSQLNYTGGKYGTALQAASALGNDATFDLLLNRNANIDIEAGIYGTALVAAAQNNRLRMVKELLIRGANTDKRSFSGRTAVYLAASAGTPEILEALISSGASINIADNDGWTPLHVASWNGHLEVVRLFLHEHGTNVNIADNDGWTPLHIASSEGHLEIALLLIKHSADINITDNDGWTPLNVASSESHLEMVQLLLNSNADINIAENHGWTPLHIASWNGHLEIALSLIKRSANINIADNDRSTPLRIASSEGHLEIALSLIKRSANINIADNDGSTPLRIASSEGHLEIALLLIIGGANINIADNDGSTPLHIASSEGHLEIALLLIIGGANINIADNDGSTPLHIASSEGHLEIALLLIKHSADINITDNDGWTPLHLASWNGHLEVVRLFLHEHGTNINGGDNDGWTPLFVASSKDHLEVVNLLLHEGASPAVTSNTGDIPLFVAMRGGHLDVVNLLIDKLIEGRLPEQSTTRQVADKELQLLVDDHGRNAFHHAARGGSVEVLSCLLQGKSMLLNEDKFGRNMFDYASMSGSLEMVEKVLESYQYHNVNTRSSSQWSPLHWACRNGTYGILELLTKSSVQSQEVDTSIPAVSWLPLDIAVYWKNTNLISEDGRILETRPWCSTINPENRTSHAISTPEDGFRSNSLGPFELFPNVECEGCFSVSWVVQLPLLC